MAEGKTNGGAGIRGIARSYSAEALHVCAEIMRNSKDHQARALASRTIIMAALSAPQAEDLEF
jgi:hypothetical protein